MAEEDAKKKVVEWQEEQIPTEFGTTYTITRQRDDEDVTYRDEDEFPQPQYHLWNWSLTNSCNGGGGGDGRCVALPEQTRFSPTHILRGELRPTTSDNNNNNNKPIIIHIQISQLKCWIIDRSKLNRGIWVESSNNAWYCLKNPAKQQEEIHTSMRARLGLISNLVDIFAESSSSDHRNNHSSDDKERKFPYMKMHAQRTPVEIHTLLTPPDHVYEDYYKEKQLSHDDVILSKTPFDLTLLESYPAFCKQQMLYFDTVLDESCRFIQGLEELIQNNTTTTTKDWTTDEYLQSALQAEARSQRTPWGDYVVAVSDDEKTPPLPITIRPNHWIDLELQHELNLIEKSTLLAKAAPEIQDDDAPSSDDDNNNQVVVVSPQRKRGGGPPTSRRRTRNSVIEDDDDDDEMEEEALPKKPTKVYYPCEIPLNITSSTDHRPKTKIAYSEQCMREALEEFKSCMDHPSEEQQQQNSAAAATWDNVLQHSFAVAETKGPDVLKLIRNPNMSSVELQLLMVTCLRNSCLQKQTKLIRKICFSAPSKKKKTTTDDDDATPSLAYYIGAKIICDSWRLHAQESLMQAKVAGDITTFEGKTTEELLLDAIMKLITECYVIKDGKQLEVLKTKYELDWKIVVDETLRFANTSIGCRPLIKSCFRVQQHLRTLMAKGGGGDAEAKKPSAPVEAAVAKKPDTLVDTETKESAEDRQKRLDKEEADRARRERMQKMMKSGLNLAGTAASAVGLATKTVYSQMTPTKESSSTAAATGGWGTDAVAVSPGSHPLPQHMASAKTASGGSTTQDSGAAKDPREWWRSGGTASKKQGSGAAKDDASGWGTAPRVLEKQAWGVAKDDAGGWGSAPVTSSGGWGTAPRVLKKHASGVAKDDAGGWWSAPVTSRGGWARKSSTTETNLTSSDVTTRDESAAAAAKTASRQSSTDDGRHASSASAAAPTARRDNQPDVQLQTPAGSSAASWGTVDMDRHQQKQTPTNITPYGHQQRQLQEQLQQQHRYAAQQNGPFNEASSYGTGQQQSSTPTYGQSWTGDSRGNDSSGYSPHYGGGTDIAVAPPVEQKQKQQQQVGYQQHEIEPTRRDSDYSSSRGYHVFDGGREQQQPQRRRRDFGDGRGPGDEPFQKRARTDNYNNRSRGATPPPAVNPAMPANVGGGRGRGRGKDVNKPAWMTQRGGPSSSNNVGPVPGASRQQESAPLAPAPPLPDDTGGGRGRGRGMTLPSWMTKPSATGNGNNVGPVSGASGQQEPAPQAPAPPSEPAGPMVGGTPLPDDPFESQKSKRGRGKGKTNKRKQQNDVPVPNRGVVANSGGAGRGRGRGRGKDVNKPAWMTRSS